MRRFLSTLVITVACALLLSGVLSADIRNSWFAVVGTIALFLIAPIFYSQQD